MLERIDTRGTAGSETGSRLGAWLRYGQHFGEDLGVVAEVRRSSRDIDAEAIPIGVSRTDWVVRARGRFLDDRLTAELFTGSSSLESGDDEAVLPVKRSVSQHGLGLSVEQGPLWARGALRLFGGPDMPARALEVEGGGELPGFGGAYGRWSSEDWAGSAAAAVTLHAWSEPFLGLSAFASLDEGVRGGRLFPPFQEATLPAEGEPALEPAVEDQAYGLGDARNLRVGASFRWRPLQVSGAWLSLETDALPPLGLDPDRGGALAAGGSFTGFEATARLDLPVEGFALTGAYQGWNEEARYLPRRLYQGGLEFHDLFMESRNLEVWGALSMEGRDPMLVPVAGASEEPFFERAPFFQSWNADVQVRILTVHLFIRWDNFTLRDNLQDFPGRRLPVTRAAYGVKWILWN
jgi:hypothetical protein